MHSPRFTISLRFFSKSINPDKISAQLGLKPKWSHKRGEPRVSPKGHALGGTYDFSYCCFSFCSIAGEEVNQTIKRIVETLHSQEQLFQRVRYDGGRAEIFIGWFSVGNTEDTFDYKLLRELEQLQIDLAFDVYSESEFVEAR